MSAKCKKKKKLSLPHIRATAQGLEILEAILGGPTKKPLLYRFVVDSSQPQLTRLVRAL
jgi:hypothetical protein